MKMECAFCKKKITFMTYQKIMIDGVTYDSCLRCKKERLGKPVTAHNGVDPVGSLIKSKPLKVHATFDEFNFESLIRAQNRTTHAVRAFVRFLFIQLTGISLALILWNLSTLSINQQDCVDYGSHCSGETSLQAVAGLVWVISIFLSSRAGWNELDKSNIDLDS